MRQLNSGCSRCSCLSGVLLQHHLVRSGIGAGKFKLGEAGSDGRGEGHGRKEAVCRRGRLVVSPMENTIFEQYASMLKGAGLPSLIVDDTVVSGRVVLTVSASA